MALTVESYFQILSAKSENTRLVVQVDNAKLAADDFRTKYVETLGRVTSKALVALSCLMLPEREEKSLSSLFSSLLKAGSVKPVSEMRTPVLFDLQSMLLFLEGLPFLKKE